MVLFTGPAPPARPVVTVPALPAGHPQVLACAHVRFAGVSVLLLTYPLPAVSCAPQDPGVSGAAPTVSHEVNQGGDDDDVDLLGGEYTREKLWLELIDVIQEMDDPMGGCLSDQVVLPGVCDLLCTGWKPARILQPWKMDANTMTSPQLHASYIMQVKYVLQGWAAFVSCFAASCPSF